MVLRFPKHYIHTLLTFISAPDSLKAVFLIASYNNLRVAVLRMGLVGSNNVLFNAPPILDRRIICSHKTNALEVCELVLLLAWSTVYYTIWSRVKIHRPFKLSDIPFDWEAMTHDLGTFCSSQLR